MDAELSVDLLRYIGEMLFELFSMLCSVIIIIKILFITHTCTTAYNIHIYVFIYHKMLNTSFTYVGKDLHIQRYVHPNRINIFVVVQTKTTAQTKTWPAGKPFLIYIAGEYRLGIL